MKYAESRFPVLLPLGFIFVVAFILVLSAQNVSSADVTLAWNPNGEDDLEGYRVFWREEGERYNYNYPAWEAYLDQLDNPGQPTCTIYNLDDGTTHYFVVRAFDAWGNESTDSNEVCLGPTADAVGGGCFISTIASGSCAEPLINVLRDFRDEYLLTNGPGRWFVKVYYRYGSYLADYVKTHNWCKPFVRTGN